MISKAMRALIFDGTSARLESAYPNATAAEGEAVIRTLKAAISATDVEICRGLLAYKGVLGSEFVGVVEAVNIASAKRDQSLIGKRVVGSIATACGSCDLCARGLRSHCRKRTVLGMIGRNGCLAERFTLPVKNLIMVPDALDDDHAVFATEAAFALQALQQLVIESKPYITILGDGSLALLTAQVMSRLNASVRLVGRHMSKLAICEKWGVKHRHMDEVGRRGDQDIVVDCTGSFAGLTAAMQMVRPRGKIVLKALHASALAGDGDSIDLSPIVLHEIELIGSFVGPVNEALAMLNRRELDVLSLISRRMNLSEGAAILRCAAQPEVIKVLVEP